MSISFIITTYNIAPYIRQCLDSLTPCLRAGDQVILVDDGSTDDTPAIVEGFIAGGGFGPDIIWSPVWLGTNTFGGVGIAGNIGLDQVQCDTVFFVDGDDYLIPTAFRRARADYAASHADIHFTDYLEFDDQAQRTKKPADHGKWDALDAPTSFEEKRLAAIGLIAVPWRKFYRTRFLQEHRIRFPEGDFFFEDNPFHWDVCLAARTIGFSRRIVCHHRVNRPGQTMASTGLELAAFFTHFRTILSAIPAKRGDLRMQAFRWLLGNMSWHLPRLSNSAFMTYAMRAEAALKLIPDRDWSGDLARQMSGSATWHYADRLRAGHQWDVVEAWKADADRRSLQDILTSIRQLGKRVAKLEKHVRSTEDMLSVQRAVDEFEALRKTFI